MTSTNPHSSDFSYKRYSLEQLDNWVHDALNCEDLTPQEIYDTIVNVVDESVEDHKKYLTKSIELLSLLKGHRPVDLGDGPYDGWDSQYTEEEMNAMCDAAEEKEKCREYNLREAEYYNKRAELDARERQAQAVAEQMKNGHSQYYYNTGRNKSYDQMIAEGWQMTDDGFWIKETEKGLSVSG